MKLIINADDFGLSKSITDGIIYGIKNNFITSTTIMMNMEYSEYAINEAIKNNINCIGLHINLTVGKPIIPNSNITDEQGFFLYNKKQIFNKKLTYDDAYTEIIAQINEFKRISSGKINIDHLDTHHHLFSNENIRRAIIDISNKMKLPLRKEDNDIKNGPDLLYKKFTIDNVNLEEIKNMIAKYENSDMTIELMTHPGYIDSYTKNITSYIGREEELNILKEAFDRGIFEKIDLISFSDL